MNAVAELKPELVRPDARLHSAWLAARAEWPPGAHMDGSGLGDGDDTDGPAGFAAWVERLLRCADPAVEPAPGRVHSTYWWIVSRGAVLGAVELRHSLSPFLLEAGGHIGYSVRPGHRGRGLAGWALDQALGEARLRDMARVLLTVTPDNAPSVRVIERAGGVREDVRETVAGPKARYWITL
ncbi:GNAT family N-acetyltransferase [Streptomyces sp. NPDC004111]|uniref:GNAT family N-acetyltransferase n=1 Tax=Streptomyces sp. NPDC004111 TaxID=3364690 RepID=UPI003673D255